MSIDKLEPFSGDTHINPNHHLKFSKYLIKKKNLFIDDRKIRCDTHIWTEIDLDLYVRNYYVNRQVRAMLFGDAYQSRPPFEIFK